MNRFKQQQQHSEEAIKQIQIISIESTVFDLISSQTREPNGT